MAEGGGVCHGVCGRGVRWGACATARRSPAGAASQTSYISCSVLRFSSPDLSGQPREPSQCGRFEKGAWNALVRIVHLLDPEDPRALYFRSVE